MRARVMFFATLVLLAACSTPPDQGAGRGQSQQQFGTLDQLLAPIALYPDQLLAQILMCAGNPAKLAELELFVQTNRNLKGTQLQDAAVRAGFEPSFVALALFPSVISNMAVQSQWTTRLGQAFAADRSAVFAAIQKLRHQAQDVGTLKDTVQQDVSTKTTSGGEDVIIIEPANPQVVYVPQYNTQTVYTTAPTTVVVQESSSADAAVAAGLIGFTAGIAIGAAMDNNYYYGPYGWHGGGYMYNDAWDDYYDAREDAREDWMDHREDIMEDRGDRAENAREQRTERSENRQDTRGTTQEQRTDRQQNRQQNRPASQTQRTQQRAQASTQSATTGSARRTGTAEARGYSGGSRAQATARSGGGSDPFSGYSSGASQRAASSRGQQSRSSSRGGGGRRR